MAKELVRELINAGVHFGHGVSRWNPKMKPYIFAKRGKIHIINIKETLKGLLIAKKLLAEVVSTGKDVVFVGTKRQAQKAVETAAQNCGMHYISNRWLGGMLTNFRTIRSRLQRLEQLEAMQQNGQLESESKKQASRLKREMKKINANLGGVRKMSRLPGAVIVVDVKKEYLALHEAAKLGIKTIGLIDTNSDPDTVDVAIPANDDSIRAIELILSELADAVAIGKTMMGANQDTQQKPKVRSKRPMLARANEADAKAAPTASADKPSDAAPAPTAAADTTPETAKAAPTVSADKPSDATPAATVAADTTPETVPVVDVVPAADDTDSEKPAPADGEVGEPENSKS